MLTSITELFEVLGDDPEKLKGEPETEWLDFKSEPYWLNTSGPDREKVCFELAKDVTAFANRDEGVILIGVRTKKDAASQDEVATELRPVPAGRVDAKQMQDVIEKWVFPRLDVEIRPHDVPDRKGQIWTVYVRRQRERDIPFMVAKEFVGDQGSSRNLFGVYERSGSDNRPYPPYQVHGWIRAGWSAPVEEPPAPPTYSTEQADPVLVADLNAIGAEACACSYYLQASPQTPTRIERFYRGAPDSLHDTLFSIPHLRAAGFNLPDGLQPERTGSAALRVVWRQNDSLSVTPGGLTTAIQGEEHLTWAHPKVAPEGEIWINLLALVEFTLEFWRFYVGQIQARMEMPGSTAWRAGMRGLGDPIPVYLPAGFYRRSQRQRADADSFDLTWSSTDERDPGHLAFEVLANIYSRFGFDEGLIPYAEGRRISERAILDVKRGG